jgi:molybdopterin-guanine dinucleotide biosynthesis protein A
VTRPPTGIAGLVLAGGGSTRLGGGDKTLLELGGAPIMSAVISRLAAQADRIAISANGDPERFARYGVCVLADDGPPAGPLSGVLSGMRWASRQTGCSRILTVAGDTPFFPNDLAARLMTATEEFPERVAIASSGGRKHPVVALWPAGLADRLAAFLAVGRTFKVAAFLDTLDTAVVDFLPIPTLDGAVDPFFNVNTPADLAEARAIYRSLNP